MFFDGNFKWKLACCFYFFSFMLLSSHFTFTHCHWKLFPLPLFVWSIITLFPLFFFPNLSLSHSSFFCFLSWNHSSFLCSVVNPFFLCICSLISHHIILSFLHSIICIGTFPFQYSDRSSLFDGGGGEIALAILIDQQSQMVAFI